MDSHSATDVNDAGKSQRLALSVVLFTDIIESVDLKEQFGESVVIAAIENHHRLVRSLLARFPGAKEIKTIGDSFHITFPLPSEAVQFALTLQSRLRKELSDPVPIQDRIGIHLGTVFTVPSSADRPEDMLGTTVDIAARVMSLAKGDQILCTRSVFDNARQFLFGREMDEIGPLSWVIHSQYKLKGISALVEICEVGEKAKAVLMAPPGSFADDMEEVGKWRPEPGRAVPDTNWVLTERLGEGGFGETWKAENRDTKEVRAFKFCFDPDRARNLKREKFFFDRIRKKLGEIKSFVRMYRVNIERPPYYLEMEYIEALDLRRWLTVTKQAGQRPSTRAKLDLIAQVAEALALAHSANVLHNDVSPGNILICSHSSAEGGSLSVKLSDFGIGRLVAKEKVDDYYISGLSTGAVAQTPLYLAPELLQRKQATPQSDLFSLGVVLYQLYKGDMEAPVPVGSLEKHVRDRIVLKDLRRLLASDPSQRPSDGEEVARQLRTYPKRKRARTFRKAMFAVVIGITSLALAVLVYWLIIRPPEEDYYTQISEAGKKIHARDFSAAMEELEGQPFLKEYRDWEWGRLKLECSRSGEGKVSLKGKAEVPVTALAFSPDDKHIVSGSEDNTVRIWDLQTCEARILTNEAKSFALSPDGRLIACGAQGNVIRIWNVQTQEEELPHLTADSLAIVQALAFSPDGKRIAAAGAGLTKVGEANKQVGRIQLWDVSALTQPGESQVLPDSSVDVILRIAFSPDSRRIAGTGFSGERQQSVVRVWHTMNPAKPVRIKPEQILINDVVFSPYKAKRWLATGGGTPGEHLSELKIWDYGKGSVTRLFDDEHGDCVWALAFNRTGRRLVSGAEDGAVLVWVPKKGRRVMRLSVPSAVRAVTFSWDGRRIAAGCGDGTIVIWDALTWW